MLMPSNIALVTGASAGIGSIHADRRAAHGHDLAPVARRRDRFEVLAARLRTDRGRNLERTPPWLDFEPARENLSRGPRESDRPATRHAGPWTADGG